MCVCVCMLYVCGPNFIMTLYNVKKVLNYALESLCVWQSSKKRKIDSFLNGVTFLPYERTKVLI